MIKHFIKDSSQSINQLTLRPLNQYNYVNVVNDSVNNTMCLISNSILIVNIPQYCISRSLCKCKSISISKSMSVYTRVCINTYKNMYNTYILLVKSVSIGIKGQLKGLYMYIRYTLIDNYSKSKRISMECIMDNTLYKTSKLDYNRVKEYNSGYNRLTISNIIINCFTTIKFLLRPIMIIMFTKGLSSIKYKMDNNFQYQYRCNPDIGLGSKIIYPYTLI